MVSSVLPIAYSFGSNLQYQLLGRRQIVEIINILVFRLVINYHLFIILYYITLYYCSLLVCVHVHTNNNAIR